MGDQQNLRRAGDLASENARLRIELEHARAQVKDLLREACTDELTGLLNRRGFLRLGQGELDRARASHQPLTLVYADVDGLKAVNDNAGHDAGDLLLVEASALLRAAFRDVDVVARLGGDEFAVLASDFLGDGALIRHRLDKVGESLHRKGLFRNRVSLSVGVIQVPAGADAELTSLLLRGDEAMYAIKRERRPAQLRQAPSGALALVV